MKYFSLTDVGKKRSNNEDDYFSKVYTIQDTEVGLFMVADGMGGYEFGEYASKKTLEVIKDNLSVKLSEIDIHLAQSKEIFSILKKVIQSANNEVVNVSSNKDIFMGTTIALALVIENSLYVANVGDSRTYLLNDNKLLQVSKDNSYVQELVDMGAIDITEARTHNERNKITRAVGVDYDLDIDFYKKKLQPNDKILLCSDGLNTMLDDGEIEQIVKLNEPLEVIVKKLLAKVYDKGASDNTTITCILI